MVKKKKRWRRRGRFWIFFLMSSNCYQLKESRRTKKLKQKGSRETQERDTFNIIRVFYLVFITITNNSAQALEEEQEQEEANGEEEQEEV